MLKRLFQVNPDTGTIHSILLILRICVAALMLRHGIPKLHALLSDGEIKFADPIGLGPEVSLILVVFAEFLCSAFILAGLGTRIVTIPLIINMSVIIFIVHLHDPFSRKELPVFYLLTYIILLILGSGKYSFDHIIYKRLSRK